VQLLIVNFLNTVHSLSHYETLLSSSSMMVTHWDVEPNTHNIILVILLNNAFSLECHFYHIFLVITLYDLDSVCIMCRYNVVL